MIPAMLQTISRCVQCVSLNAATGNTTRAVLMPKLHELSTTISYASQHSVYHCGVSSVPASCMVSAVVGHFWN